MSNRLEVKVRSSLDIAPKIPGYECHFVRVDLRATMQKTFIYRRLK